MHSESAHKIKLLLASLLTRPAETWDRLFLQLTDRWHIKANARSLSPYRTDNWRPLLRRLSSALGGDLEAFLAETERERISHHVLSITRQTLQNGPFRVSYNGDRRLADLCYAVCRALKPRVVIETGVAYGVTSAYILQAMATNGIGTLHSIDLPPVAALDTSKESFVGLLVPQDLRERWHLHRGTSARVLPELLPELGEVDMAVLDSRFTYAVKFGEMQMLKPMLAPSSVLIADDVDRSAAFTDWIALSDPLLSAVVNESAAKAGSMMGITVHRSSSLPSAVYNTGADLTS